jgi:uncharacterized protein (DUF952 family)
MDTKGKIYHIVPVTVWDKALLEARYRPESLRNEGFIHCSTFEQVLGSAELHFRGHDELVVVSLIEKHCKPILKWEPGRGEELFPHLYGDFPWSAVETSRMLTRNGQGNWEWE